MRPISKGPAPTVYTRYQDAGPDLQQCIGDYCSFCERQIETHLAVEHIQCKSHAPGLRNVWDNFLLACVNCNSCKGDTPLGLQDYLWPDCDNTLLALEYTRGGIIGPSRNLAQPLQAKAQASIELTGLDKYPGNPMPGRRPTHSDRRWQRRLEAWQLAERDRQLLADNNSAEVRELIVENALGRGMFSIWWTVFDGDVDMRRRLREAFLGTDPGCFNGNEYLQTRAGGQV